MSNVDKIDIHRYNEVVHCNNDREEEREKTTFGVLLLRKV